MSEFNNTEITEGAYPAVFFLLNLKREALGLKPIKAADMKYTDAGSSVFLAGEKNANKLMRVCSKVDLKGFVSPSKANRLQAAINFKGWRTKKLMDVVMDPENEMISIDYK